MYHQFLFSEKAALKKKPLGLYNKHLGAKPN